MGPDLAPGMIGGGGGGKDEAETGGNGKTKNTWKVKCSLYGGNSREWTRFAPRLINLFFFFFLSCLPSFLACMCLSLGPSLHLF